MNRGGRLNGRDSREMRFEDRIKDRTGDYVNDGIGLNGRGWGYANRGNGINKRLCGEVNANQTIATIDTIDRRVRAMIERWRGQCCLESLPFL